MSSHTHADEWLTGNNKAISYFPSHVCTSKHLHKYLNRPEMKTEQAAMDQTQLEWGT